jgi:hypothetical protein
VLNLPTSNQGGQGGGPNAYRWAIPVARELGRQMAGLEGEGTLLDHSILMLTSSLFDGDLHTANQLPILLTGRGGGTLRPGVGDADLLRASFPPGSVTGAPKIQTMRVIAELEATARPGGVARGFSDGPRHGCGGVRIDDIQAHGVFPAPGYTNYEPVSGVREAEGFLMEEFLRSDGQSIRLSRLSDGRYEVQILRTDGKVVASICLGGFSAKLIAQFLTEEEV